MNVVLGFTLFGLICPLCQNGCNNSVQEFSVECRAEKRMKHDALPPWQGAIVATFTCHATSPVYNLCGTDQHLLGITAT